MATVAPDLQQRARGVRLLVLDVDGVLTDGRLYNGPDEIELKAFHTQDGHGLKMLRDSGVEVAIITGRTSRAVELRARRLSIMESGIGGLILINLVFSFTLADMGAD